MKTIVVGLVAFLTTALASGPAAAWAHANAWGGTTSHAYGSGSTTRTNAWGGSETHTYGEGTTATNRYGDTATHKEGSDSTTFTNPYGGSATHTYGEGTTATSAYGSTAYHSAYYGTTAYHGAYYGAAYPAYHPPTTVNYYGSSCGNCGGWSTAGAVAAGAAVGVAAGAAMASANTSAAVSNAYSQGYVAGSVASPGYAMGAIYATLPPGATAATVQGMTYYVAGNIWFQPSYGANGVYYRVVPTP